jgi:hypothetical protein
MSHGLRLSAAEHQVLFCLGHPWATSKEITPITGEELIQARLLTAKGLAEYYGLASKGRRYYRRTQQGQSLARELAEQTPALPKE